MKTFFVFKIALTLAAAPIAAHAQFGSGIVYDPTQSAHAVQQIEQGQNIFTNSVKLADNAIATYNVVHQMSLAPQSLYQPYLSPSSYWMMLNRAANTYGNSQPWMSTANNGSNAAYAYQQASVPRTRSDSAATAISASGATANRGAGRDC